MINKKSFLLLLLLMIFLAGNIYSDDSFPGSDIIDELPTPPEFDAPAVYEPDPEDPDRDGLLTADEEYYNTDPDDPDTDNDGITDRFEIENGLDPNDFDTSGYLEVKDLVVDNNLVPASESNGLNDLPENNNTTEPDSPDEYNDLVPPDSDVDYDLIPPSEPTKTSVDNTALNNIEGINEGATLDSSTPATDLTPIYMLLLLNDDQDSDGLPDTWEMEHFGNLSYGAEDDPDEDNFSNIDEYNNNTDPNNPDTDGDGLTDGFEVLNGINPNNSDTDGDELDDGWEIANGLNPVDPDMDKDGLNDGQEIAIGTDPQDSDTDHDEMPDLWEVTSGTNPLVYDRNDDPDSDLYSNYIEYIVETKPLNSSSTPVPGQYNKYDKLGRLTNTASVIEYQIEYEIIYEYDSVGNRVKKTVR